MEPSYLQIRAMASQFDGGNNYREEVKAAAYDPSAMPQPGRRVREPRKRGQAQGRRKPMPANADWAGVVPPETKKKIVDSSVKATRLGPGLVPVTDDEQGPSRKHFERDVRFTSVDPAAHNAPLGSAAYQLGPGGRHTASDWQSEARAQMAQESGPAQRRPQKKLFGEVGPDAVVPGSDRAAREALLRARELEVRHGAPAVAGSVGPAFGARGAPRRTGAGAGAGAAARLGSRTGPNSLLSGIGAKIGYSPAVKAAGRAAHMEPSAPRATVAIPGYQGHKPSAMDRDVAGPVAARTSAPAATQRRSTRPY